MAELQKGISILYDLELNNYLMTVAIDKVKQKKATLCKAKTVTKSAKKANSYDIANAVATSLLIVAIIGAIVGAVLGHMYASKEGFFNEGIGDIWGVFFGICSYAVGIVLGAIAGGIAGIVIGIIIGLIGKAIVQKSVNEYNDNIEIEYRKALKVEEKRMADEAVKRDFMQGQVDYLQKKLAESLSVTKQIYDYVGIDSTYRNLICMGYMDEYIRLGIATKLGGVDGLYFVIKQQLNFDQINANLNVIIKKLDVIIDKQTQIYNAVQSMNFKCAQMVSELEKISYNTYSIACDSAFNTYCVERYNQEMDYLNYVNA